MISENFEKLQDIFFKTNPELKDKIKIKKVKFVLNREQRRELLNIAEKNNYQHYLIIRIMLETGIRVNELINIDIRQLNLSRAPYLIIKSRKADKYIRAFKTKTLASNRIIPINNELAKLLRAYIGKRRAGYLFLSQKKNAFLKNSVIGFINHYARMSKTIGRNIGSHTLRRTFASYLLQQNIKIAEISKLLGHASIRTTLIYLYEIEQPDYEQIRKIVKKMN